MSKRVCHVSLAWSVGLATIGGLATDALGSGLALRELSAEGLGNAHAGQTAIANSASTAFYNPAGMTRLHDSQVAGNVSWLAPVAKFTGSNSSPRGGTVAGSLPGDAVKDVAVGSAFAVWDARPDWKIGLSVAVPFGMRSEYKEDWVGRYQALASDVTDIEFSPTLAYRVSDKWSVGGGLRADYLHARLTQAINYNGIVSAQAPALLATLPPPSQPIAASALEPLVGALTDGQGKVEGDDWGLGYILSALLEPDRSTRIGLSYRSRVFHRLSGSASYQTPASLSTLAGAVGQISPQAASALAARLPADSSASAKVILPDSLTLGFYHDIDGRWALMSDISWTHWSLFKTLAIQGPSGQSIGTPTTEDWQNSWFVALGANYRSGAGWTIHAGIAYDQSPVRDQYRTARIPDSDRYQAAIGLSCFLIPRTDLHLSYTHIFADKASVNQTYSARLATGTLTGSYDNSSDVASVGVAVHF